MQSETKVKLNILKDNNLLSEQEYEVIKRTDEYFDQLNLNEDRDMFLIHFSSALHRLDSEEKIDEMPKIMIDEIEKNSKYDNAKKIIESVLEENKVTLSNTEVNYLLLHILNILEKK
ncbi:PRD domain-containing protein [Lactobacillus sp. YT155]|uniref:PRD domain-containing protein n=1 Tax=Lactobacillus sp. YT155 TaxID=3060955 RepID=UPI00265DBD3F|nr:PRD domain-containing protein [Lactobacillus sp. YT155]MDO1604943.1 PRD domain-containing protein [Lactobacillus sp. YT155]